MIALEEIRSMIKRLPGAREEPSYGSPGFKVKKKLFARLHQKEDAVVIVLNSVQEQQRLIAENPEIYYIIEHSRGYLAVLLNRYITEVEFFPILERAWRRVAGKGDLLEYEEHNGRAGA